MMPSLCQVTILGHVGRVSEKSFTIAVNAEKDLTNWYTIVPRKPVQVEKGQLVLVAGKLVQREMEGKTTCLVFADNVVAFKK